MGCNDGSIKQKYEEEYTKLNDCFTRCEVMCRHNFINYNYLIIYIQPFRNSIESNIFAIERITYDSICAPNQIYPAFLSIQICQLLVRIHPCREHLTNENESDSKGVTKEANERPHDPFSSLLRLSYTLPWSLFHSYRTRCPEKNDITSRMELSCPLPLLLLASNVTIPMRYHYKMRPHITFQLLTNYITAVFEFLENG